MTKFDDITFEHLNNLQDGKIGEILGENIR